MNKILNNNILLKRLLFVMFCLQVLVFLGAISLYYSIGSAIVKKESETKAEIVFNTISHEFEHTILDSKQDLIAWAEKIPNGKYSKSSCSIPYTNYLELKDYYFNYAIADKDGFIVCSKVPYPKDYNLTNSVPGYPEFVQSKEFRVTGFGLNAQGIPRIAAGYPLLDKDQNFVGAVIVSINLEKVNSLINDLKLPEDAEFIITDETGAIEVMNPIQEEQIGKRNISTEIFSVILSQQQGIKEFKDGNNKIKTYIFKPLEFDSDDELESFMIFSRETEGRLFFLFIPSCLIPISLFLLSLVGQGIVVYKVFSFKSQQKPQL